MSLPPPLPKVVAATETAPNPPTLLLVDDEESILSSLRRLFRRDGYRILTATGGAQALEILAGNAVDVIISDQRMPGMTGVEFLRQVKALYPDTVRISLSGYTELQSITEAINEGSVYKFLTKPWDDDHLRANVVEALRYKKVTDENHRLTSELAEANDRLRRLLGEQEQQLHRDETALGVVQEVLQAVPLPIVGLDDEGLIAVANRAAEELLGGNAPLIGSYADEALPPALRPSLGETTTKWQDGSGRPWRVGFRRLGPDTVAQGTLVVLSSLGETQETEPPGEHE